VAKTDVLKNYIHTVMKTKLLLLLLTLFVGTFSFGQAFTGTYTFNSVTTTSGITDPTPVPTATGVIFGAFNANVTVLPANPNAAGRYSYTDWDTGATDGNNTFSGTINTGKYYQVTITPAAGYILDINSITFTLQRSGTGIRQYAVRSSLDYTTNLPASVSPANGNITIVPTNIFQVADSSTGANNGNTITLDSSYDAISSAVTFRFYGWNAEAAGGTFSIDNVVINGVASSATPPDIVISDNGTQVIDANVQQGTTDHILSKFKIDVTESTATLTDAYFATGGNYEASDINANGFKLWYSATNTFATATQVGTGLPSTSTGFGDILGFSSFTRTIPVGTGYFWITASISATATAGRVINIDAIANADLTFISGNKSGSATSAGIQTIILSNPDTPATFTRGCTTNTTQVLNWTPPTTGTFDGYILVVREGAIPNAITSIVASSQSFNLDYSLAPTYNATTSKVLYIGTGTTATVTGLAPGITYTFALYSYKNNGTTSLYSGRRTTSPTVSLPNVSNITTTPLNTSGTIGWSNPTAGCYDQILAVVTTTSGITFSPSGDGTSYSPNTIYASPNQVVYNSTGNSVTITGLTNGVTYYVEIFVRRGTEWSTGVEVSLTPDTIIPTVLKTGDLLLIACDNNFESSADDAIRLVNMVDITQGTNFIWANATYETGGRPASNVSNDKWYTCNGTADDGNVPYLQFTYTGSAIIPAGSTFCIRTVASGTSSTISAVSPSGTVFTSFTTEGKTANGTNLISHNSVNISVSSPDSMFLMQGTFNYNATGSSFTGNVLSAIQFGASWHDLSINLSSASGDALRISRKHPSLLCASIQANTTPGSFGVRYNVSSSTYTTGSKTYLLGSILNYSSNWLNSFGSCPSTSPFIINNSASLNSWTGNLSTNWFDCNNWSLLFVPNNDTDILVNNTASRDAVISYTAPYSDLFSDIARCKDLTISGRKIQLKGNALNKLEVHGNLIITNATADAALDMNDGNSATTDGQLYLYGNWTNDKDNDAFDEGNGIVHFKGSSPQLINSITPLGTESFYNIILDNDFDTDVSNDLVATGDLTVLLSRTLTANSNGYIRVNNKLINNGNVIIENDSQLIQVNETDNNTGTASPSQFIVRRNYTAKDIDYVYWSSPVEGVLPSSLPNGYRYQWNTLYNNTNGTQGNWRPITGTYLEKGKGVIARTFNGSSTNVTNTFTFSGKPHNGLITSMTVSRGNYYGDGITTGLPYDAEPANPNNVNTTRWDDNWNLIGNPYPSALNVEKFLDANSNLEGFVNIWTHNDGLSVVTDPFYYNFGYNYNTDDYITHNGTATLSGPTGFNGNIASGQGFFVLMSDGPTTTENIIFNNAMRSDIANSQTYNNSQFYRTAEFGIEPVEKNRIWLDIISSQGKVNRTVVGYVTNATNNKDRLYDAVTNASGLKLYSFSDDYELQEFCIQGRSLPFVDSDKVRLGFNVTSPGNYSIAISDVDGLFEGNQNIYLEDKQLNIIHDLKQSPYHFTAPTGVNNTRFILRYTTNALGNADFDYDNQVVIFSKNNLITINSSVQTIDEVQVYDVLGRQLYQNKSIENQQHSFTKDIAKQTIIVKVKLQNGIWITKKVLVK
jgi:hypothetical protein